MKELTLEECYKLYNEAFEKRYGKRPAPIKVTLAGGLADFTAALVDNLNQEDKDE